MAPVYTVNPYLTADVPGIGGIIKESPDDFIVEEIPAYLPCGSGEHCYLTIEKRGITTLEAIHRIAARLKISERDVGYAGMKDAVGITRQTLSLPKISSEKAHALQVEGVTVVSAERHTNKLKIGHLKGNRFRVVIRGVSDSAAERIPVILDVLGRRGVPNYFGSQRYGAQGNSHLIGAAMLRRDWQGAVDFLIGDPEAIRDEAWSAAIKAYRQGAFGEALRLFPRHCHSERDVLQRLCTRPGEYEKALSAAHPRLKKLYLSAAQSFLFDQAVARRIDELDKIVTGDLACKHVNGACFLVEDAAAEQERADSFEISPTGPMFGCAMKMPEGVVREREQNILDQAGLTLPLFDMSGGLRMEGERRALRVQPGEVAWTIAGETVTLEFTLPKGSYATSLLREITRTF
jgi:tRNA pseudouridine13 synthase